MSARPASRWPEKAWAFCVKEAALGKKAKAKREAKASAKDAAASERFKAKGERYVDSVVDAIGKALREDDRAELERIEAEHPDLGFEELTYSEKGGDTYTFPRAAGLANRKDALAFFADHIAKRAPFEPSMTITISDTFVAADQAIRLSVAYQGWAEKEATAWLLGSFRNLVQAFGPREFDSLCEANTLYQACPEFQEAFRQLVGQERARRDRESMEQFVATQYPSQKRSNGGTM
jgi:hypothetical protein